MDKKNKNPDWGYLNKFKEDNIQIIAQHFEEKRIVFFGDSIIAGWAAFVRWFDHLCLY